MEGGYHAYYSEADELAKVFGATVEAQAQRCRVSVFMCFDERGLATRVCYTHDASLPTF